MHLRTVAIGTLVALAAQDITFKTSATPSAVNPIPTHPASDLSHPFNAMKVEGAESIAKPETLIGPRFAVNAAGRSQVVQLQMYGDAASAAVVPNGLQSSSMAIASELTDAQGHPRQEVIAAFQARGILEEFENGRFAPDDLMTGDEFSSLLEKTFEQPPINTKQLGDRFEIPASFQKKLRDNSADTAVKSNQPISRVQVLVALAKKMNLEATSETNLDLNAYFQDASEIPQEVRSSVEAAIANNLIVTQPNQPLPTLNQAATKTEVAALLYKALVANGEVSSPREATKFSDVPVLEGWNNESDRLEIKKKDRSFQVTANSEKSSAATAGTQSSKSDSPITNNTSSASPATDSLPSLTQAYRIPHLEVNSSTATRKEFPQQVARSASNQSQETVKAQADRISTRLDALRNSMQSDRLENAGELPPLGKPDIYLPKSPAIVQGYTWPAQGVISSGYGWRWGRMHNGIDIAGPIGTPIVAAASGVVTYAQWNEGGYGYLVEITHPDGSLTRYAHNNRILVREGQTVEQGQQIAEMGTTGYSTGPHCHFEILAAGKGAVDPMAYLPEDQRDSATYRRIGQGGP